MLYFTHHYKQGIIDLLLALIWAFLRSGPCVDLASNDDVGTHLVIYPSEEDNKQENQLSQQTCSSRGLQSIVPMMSFTFVNDTFR